MSTEQRNISDKLHQKFLMLIRQHCTTKSKLHIQPLHGRPVNPYPSYITARDFSGLILWRNWNRNSWVGGDLNHELFICVWFEFLVALRDHPYMGFSAPQLLPSWSCHGIWSEDSCMLFFHLGFLQVQSRLILDDLSLSWVWSRKLPCRPQGLSADFPRRVALDGQTKE